MSCDAMVQVWFFSDSKGIDRLVLLTIADEADEDGYCRINFSNVARKAALSIEELEKVVDGLINGGHLKQLKDGVYQIVYKGAF